jgi:Ca-activated chloride channel family protein
MTFMKNTLQLDYPAILANTARPVHLAITFETPEVTGARPQPVAFVAVVDRSGSMQGEPLTAAKRATRTVVRNLRKGDYFGLVVFDDQARTLVPLADTRDEMTVMKSIDQIGSGGSTNLAGGWALGRDLLSALPAGFPRKLLLLTDGELNVGVVEPELVKKMVAMGLEKNGLRTSCLGFGDNYNEDLLEALANATGGGFHNARKPDSLPEIFRKELDGLQSIVVQNLRVRVRSCGFVDRISMMGEYPELTLDEKTKEYALGDFVSGERRVAVLALDVLPIPLGADGRATATWDGEDLVMLEIRYDTITPEGLVTHVEAHRVKVLPVQSAGDVQVNTDVLPWVSLQSASAAVERALRARDEGNAEQARAIVQKEIDGLATLPASDLLVDARRLLDSTLRALEDGADYNSGRKMMRSMNRYFSKGSSADDAVLETGQWPSFKSQKPKPASDQADQDRNVEP